MEFDVRRRRVEDLPGCVAALRDTHDVNGYPWAWPVDADAWLSPASTLAAWIAVADGQVQGHVLLADLTARTSAISRLFVVPPAQGRGVAVALLAEATAAARSLGRRVELDVVEESVAAIKLYERLGWTLVEQRAADFTWPDGTRPVQRRYCAPDQR